MNALSTPEAVEDEAAIGLAPLEEPTVPLAGAPLPFWEFVTLIAAVMALGALGIDAMLPALPAIGEALGVAGENTRQFVITAFVVGFGAGQLIHGPLADAYGRRPVLLWALGLNAIACLLCAGATSFSMLLAARLCSGLAVACSRVVPVAMVRDCYQGRSMARVMSTAFIVFMIVPVLAPNFGAGVLLFGGDWRMIFAGIAVLTLAVAGWFAWRMPETQAREDRLPLSGARIVAGWRRTVSDRLSLGYMLAAGATTGGIYGYVNSIQQVVGDAFGRPGLLPLVFASTAGTMALSNFANSRLVLRFGQRLLSQSAVCALMGTALLHLAIYATGRETLVMFALLQALTMGCFGLIGTNFSSMAMSNMGPIAGTASSVQGFASILIGSAIGAAIGQAFDGSARPMILGFAVAGALALAMAAWTERGRLFRAA